MQAAYDMLLIAAAWRSQRRPHDVENMIDWEEKLSHESETGKVYVPGRTLMIMARSSNLMN